MLCQFRSRLVRWN